MTKEDTVKIATAFVMDKETEWLNYKCGKERELLNSSPEESKKIAEQVEREMTRLYRSGSEDEEEARIKKLDQKKNGGATK